MSEKIKPFWVVSVNNYLCGASYDGKKLKDEHVSPSFRKFTFIRSMDELRYFEKRKEINNEELINTYLTKP